MRFDTEEEKNLFKSAVGSLNRLIGKMEEKEDNYARVRKNLIIFPGGASDRGKVNEESNSLSLKEGDDEELSKNIRKRSDGRWEFRKSIYGRRIYIIKSNKGDLDLAVKEFKQNLKNKIFNVVKSKSFFELSKDWIYRYKSKLQSFHRYKSVLKLHISKLTMPIGKITKDILQDFLNGITAHRSRDYAFFIIKGVFEDETDKRNIKFNVAQNLKKPKSQGEKGTNFTLDEQKLILENLPQEIRTEILFYLLTGSRKTEATNIKINFEKNSVFIDGTKTRTAKRYVPLSESFCNMIKLNEKTFFARSADFYYRKFKEMIDKLGIKSSRLHDLRHTFSTNLYYLGATDKQRQYFLGHANIAMTNDIYTHLDPTITKQDIIELYGDLYPKF